MGYFFFCLQVVVITANKCRPPVTDLLIINRQMYRGQFFIYSLMHVLTYFCKLDTSLAV